MAAKAKYSATTRQILVTVSPTYLEDQSVPENSHFLWAYHVVIENRGPETVQLRSRHWRITNARGERHEVRGPGVVGEQPRLEPGGCVRIYQPRAAHDAVGHHDGQLSNGNPGRRKLRRRDPRLFPGQPPSVSEA